VKHVFVSPHPDDIALSCGGLVACLCDRGDDVTILTVFSGPGDLPRLTPFQRLALGFGGEDAQTPTQAPTPGEVMTIRRAEDAEYARFVGASIVFVNRPDAVFRGYGADQEIMGPPRDDDPAPTEELHRALTELAPDRVYLPFAVGGHVDHRQTHRAALTLMSEPESPYLRCTAFYEDFPYAMRNDFQGLDQLVEPTLDRLPAGVKLEPEYVEIDGLLDRKLAGLRAYDSQMGHLFGGDDSMVDAVRGRVARVGAVGGVGPSERFWRVCQD
jgi:LmbE family N-acetylglucosaminyl deacetylase